MLKARVITALILLGVFLVALFLLPEAGWAGFVAIVIGAAAAEWGGLAGFAQNKRLAYALVTALLSFTLYLALIGPMAGGTRTVYALACLFWLVVVPLWLQRKWRLENGSVAVAVGWIVLLPAGLALVQLRGFSPFVVFAVMAAVWTADIAAYFTGRAFGRHRLAPRISPGKTWEGALGAVIAVVVYGVSILVWQGRLPGNAAALFAVVAGLVLLTGISVAGDLLESLLKRQAGVKDSGRLLPGHGGILDRIDSLASALPLVGLVWSILYR